MGFGCDDYCSSDLGADAECISDDADDDAGDDDGAYVDEVCLVDGDDDAVVGCGVGVGVD